MLDSIILSRASEHMKLDEINEIIEFSKWYLSIISILLYNYKILLKLNFIFVSARSMNGAIFTNAFIFPTILKQ